MSHSEIERRLGLGRTLVRRIVADGVGLLVRAGLRSALMEMGPDSKLAMLSSEHQRTSRSQEEAAS
jgi:hypothetical protein